MSSKNVYGLILAGGSGSRLWPISREMYPKQLLKIADEYTLFQSTFLRLIDCIDDKNILSITNVKHEGQVRYQLDELREKFCRKSSYRVISEPVGKNTAPAIALAIKYIEVLNEKKFDPIIVATPSDHCIFDNKKFTKAIDEAIKLAENDYIVTFGVTPTKPDTGFGYIKTKNNKKLKEISPKALKVEDFTEKPDKETAKKFAVSKNYFWNSGIFVFKASVMMSELKKYQPNIYDIMKKMEISSQTPTVPYQEFDQMPDISIDYAVMEDSKKLVLLPFDFHWEDLGSWEAIYEISEKDENGNYILGNVIDLDSKNSMLYSTSKLVTTIGLENTIVVETEDAILVCDRDRVQDVKQIYSFLKERDDETHKIHKTVYRPWGYYTVLKEGNGFLTKCIYVNPKAKLSLQLHHHRSEHWVVLEGNALVIKGENQFKMEPGESIDIDIEEIHSLQNPYDEPVMILEVQKGDILDENDIVRLQDMYGRV